MEIIDPADVWKRWDFQIMSIEQEMRWAVLEENNQDLQKNIQRILKAITEAVGDSEKRELARWVKGTLPNLAGTEQFHTEQQWLSQYVVAALGMTGAWWGNNVELHPLPELLIKALPKDKTQKVGLRLRPGILEVLKSEDGIKTIEISMPLPTTVMLNFPSENNIRAVEPFWIGRLIRLPTTAQDIRLHLLDGSSFQLSRDKPIKVFISYSHDSGKHREFVRNLSDRLRSDGLECVIDQYINTFPPEGWQRWMEKQIEVADFVLLICTPNYLKRYQSQDRDGGRGVNFEGLVISQALYDNYYPSTKFVPVILSEGSHDHVPLPLKRYSVYRLPDDYIALFRMLTGQAELTSQPFGKLATRSLTSRQNVSPIYSDRLPTVKGGFFGREAELQLLNDAWEDKRTCIVQLIAPAGMGKTKLLRHWIDHTTDIPVLIAWSFYSQGSNEDKQTSATPFFRHAFEKLGSLRERFASEEDKGEHLAELLYGKHYVLVLDGLESLQHSSTAMRGELKDRSIRQLLKSLVKHNTGLCIITTRIAVHELSDRTGVITHDLQNHNLEDGINLLRSLGVHGSIQELAETVKEYGYHPLTLNLLGNAIRTFLDGDVRKRDTLPGIIGDYDSTGRHATKVMQAYSHWLEGTAELQLLHLLGLFNHPIETNVLQVLWQARIPNLTAGIPQKAWKISIRDLREKHRMLSPHEDRPDLLDCHPLIREYFGKQLQEQQPQAWQQAHTKLYDYYKSLPKKELPDTLEEMQPLFSAVMHGCAAGLHRQALNEVYWPRIQRMNQNYLTKKLGAFSEDLSNLGNFFTKHWHTPTANLTEREQAVILNWAAFRLRSLGRLKEALEPAKASLDRLIKQKDWEQAAAQASNFSELHLAIGDVTVAIDAARKSMNYADQSEHWQQKVSSCLTYAHTLHQAGEIKQAIIFFQKAEQLQQEERSYEPYLYGQGGYRYCDLLLLQGETALTQERAKYALKISKKNAFLLDIALDQLTLGRTYLQQKDFSQATNWLDQAVAGLRASGDQSHLPLGLLARAVLHRHTHNFARTKQDLQEVFDIAEPSSMRLH